MKLRKEFYIGLWSIIALVALFLGINYLKGIKTLHAGSIYYLACDKVDGLAVSSHISLHGYQIGMVRGIDYDRTTDQVIVTLNVYDTDLRIPRDSHVAIKPDLLGTADVVLTMGQSDQCYNDYDTIFAPPTPAGLLDKADPIVAQVEQLMPKVDTLIAGINVLVNESQLHESLLQVHTMTTRLNQTVADLNRLLRTDVPTVMGHVSSATANLDTLALQLREADVQRIVANADQTLAQANSLLELMQSPDGSMGRMLHSAELHDQLSATVADIDSLIADIKRNPKRYINIKVF